MPRTVAKREHTANVEFVREVEKYPCLYNNTLEEYSKRDVVAMAWANVSDACGEPIEDCKDKWKNLRTVFVRNMKPRPGVPERKAPYYLNQAIQFVVPYVKVVATDEASVTSHLPSSGTGEDEDDEDVQHSSQPAHTGTLGRTQESGTSEKVNTGRTSNPKMKIEPNLQVDSRVDYLKGKKKKLAEANNTSHRESFLLSLLPDVESMSAPQFRVFRRGVLDVIDDALGLS